MNDIFCEQLVKKPPTLSDAVIKALIILTAVIIAFITLLFFGPIVLAVVLGEFFLARYIFSLFRIEYEYSFTSGDLDIDVVYNKSRRKRKLTANLKSCEYMRKLREGERPPKTEKLYDFSRRVADAEVWMVALNIKKERSIILFEPNEEMINAIYKSIARKLQK